MLIIPDGPAIAQAKNDLGALTSTVPNVVLFLAVIVILAAGAKLDDAYFDWLKRRMPRWLFLTMAFGSLGLGLLIAAIAVGPMIIK